MKDHEVRELVNALRDAALKYRDAQQLREQIARLVRPAIIVEHVSGEELLHRRVISLLLEVCRAAFNLADDSCQQNLYGEPCHVVPDYAFTQLSDALGAIETSLPHEYAAQPEIVFQGAAIAGRALSGLFQPSWKGPTPAIADVLAERHRQITVKGFTAQRDDSYTAGELAAAALCYIKPAEADSYWPDNWPDNSFKPSDYRKNLVKAAALIIAEIERTDRATGDK